MSKQFLFSFSEEISLTERQSINIQSPKRQITLQSVTPGFRSVLQALLNGGATLEQMRHWMQQGGENYAILKFQSYLQAFSRLGWLCYSVYAAQRAIANPAFIVLVFSFVRVTIN